VPANVGAGKRIGLLTPPVGETAVSVQKYLRAGSVRSPPRGGDLTEPEEINEKGSGTVSMQEMTVRDVSESGWESLVASALMGIEESPGWTDCWPSGSTGACCTTSPAAPEPTI